MAESQPRCAIRLLEGHECYATCFKLLPDVRLVSGSHDHTIKIWNLDRILEKSDQSIQAYEHSLQGHYSHFVCLKILP